MNTFYWAFHILVAFVVMRLIFGGFIVGRTKEEEKENAEEN